MRSTAPARGTIPRRVVATGGRTTAVAPPPRSPCMGFLLDGRCQCGYEIGGLAVGVGMKHGPDTWLSPCACGRCRAIVSANVRAAPITCPKCRGRSVVPLVDPDHGCEADEAFPSCQASEPLMEDRFACPKCGTRQLRFRFAGLWD